MSGEDQYARGVELLPLKEAASVHSDSTRRTDNSGTDDSSQCLSASLCCENRVGNGVQLNNVGHSASTPCAGRLNLVSIF